MRSVNLTEMFQKLQEALSLAGAELKALQELKNDLARNESNGVIAILKRLDQMESKIMAGIADYVTSPNAYNDRIDAAVATLTTEVATLNTTITTLQNSPGAITPADQASLDALQARGLSIATKLEALDAIPTPPAPVVPPGA